MDRTERFYRIEQMLRERRTVPLKRISRRARRLARRLRARSGIPPGTAQRASNGTANSAGCWPNSSPACLNRTSAPARPPQRAAGTGRMQRRRHRKTGAHPPDRPARRRAAPLRAGRHRLVRTPPAAFYSPAGPMGQPRNLAPAPTSRVAPGRPLSTPHPLQQPHRTRHGHPRTRAGCGSGGAGGAA